MKFVHTHTTHEDRLHKLKLRQKMLIVSYLVNCLSVFAADCMSVALAVRSVINYIFCFRWFHKCLHFSHESSDIKALMAIWMDIMRGYEQEVYLIFVCAHISATIFPYHWKWKLGKCRKNSMKFQENSMSLNQMQLKMSNSARKRNALKLLFSLCGALWCIVVHIQLFIAVEKRFMQCFKVVYNL